MVGVVVAVLGGPHDHRTAPGRWLLIGFVPVTMFAKLGDRAQTSGASWTDLLSGGGRTGWDDSVNRMWMHAVLVVLLLLVQRTAATPDESLTAKRRTSRSVTATGPVVVLAVGVWVALQWQPPYAPLPPTAAAPIVITSGSQAAGELIDGSSVRQEVTAPVVDLPADSRPRQVCADVTVVTYGRENVGVLTLEFTFGRVTETTVVPAGALVDFGTIEACVDLSRDEQRTLLDPLPPMTVEVLATGAGPGEAVSVLIADDAPPALGLGAEGAIATTADARGVLSQSVSGPLVMDLVVRYSSAPSWVGRLIEWIVLLLPWVVLILGAALIHDDRRERASRPNEPYGATARLGRR
jgi:hypothetical protein